MKIVKLLKWSVLLLALGAIIAGVIWWKAGDREMPVAELEPAKIVDVRPMVRLCSVEVYEDVPIKANIGTRHIFARATLTGTISFDLEQTRDEWRGDTLFVYLPPEIVEIRESTDRGSYKVIDTWNEKFLGKSNFTAQEENEIKRKAVESWREGIYSRGYVRRAREEAVSRLASMLRPFVGEKVIVVTDLTPDGKMTDGRPGRSLAVEP